MSNLKYRLAIIVGLVLLSIYALFPRDVKTRQRHADGTFYDTVTRRVPLRKGLDLSGGMLSLGGRPTFDDDRRTIEAHLFDASGNFYGDVVQVSFVAHLRGIARFPDASALVAQLATDGRDARRALTALAGSGNLSGSTPVPPSTQ